MKFMMETWGGEAEISCSDDVNPDFLINSKKINFESLPTVKSEIKQPLQKHSKIRSQNFLRCDSSPPVIRVNGTRMLIPPSLALINSRHLF